MDALGIGALRLTLGRIVTTKNEQIESEAILRLTNGFS